MPADQTLGRALLRTLENLDPLIAKATASNLKKLKAQRRKLLEQLGALVEANLDKASEDYRGAREGLQAAAGAIRNAITGIEKVAQAIRILGQALDLVAKLIPA